MVHPAVFALVAFALGVAFGPIWLRFLRSHRLGKQVNPSEPEENKKKEGTPTMGGVAILAPVLAVTLAFQVLFAGQGIVLVSLALALGLTILGIADDLQTLVGRKRSAGLSPAVKWGVELPLCAGACAALAWSGTTQVHVPFLGAYTLPVWTYVPLVTFVLLGTVSGVAITDGLDSLAATTCAIAFAAYWVIAAARGHASSAALCATVVGALLAYLWFNAHPAQMFMGDTGALPLGGLLGTVALLEGEPLLLVAIGVIFFANAASTILQVASVKLRGKRLFRIAPLHNHYQRVGWAETWIVQRFWIVGAVGALVGVLLAAGA